MVYNIDTELVLEKYSNYSVVLMIFIVLHKNQERVSGTKSPRSGATAPQPRIFGVDYS